MFTSCEALANCEVRSMGPIFKTEMLIYQSKADLVEKDLFGRIIQELEKCL